MTIVTLNAPTGCFATGLLCDDYAYQYSNTFSTAGGQRVSYIFYHSGYGVASGINWLVQVTDDPSESAGSFYNYVSGTIAGTITTGVNIDTGYTFTRAGMRIDISGGTAISGFAWVGTQ
jgi:hypothetical protein